MGLVHQEERRAARSSRPVNVSCNSEWTCRLSKMMMTIHIQVMR